MVFQKIYQKLLLHYETRFFCPRIKYGPTAAVVETQFQNRGNLVTRRRSFFCFLVLGKSRHYKERAKVLCRKRHYVLLSCSLVPLQPANRISPCWWRAPSSRQPLFLWLGGEDGSFLRGWTFTGYWPVCQVGKTLRATTTPLVIGAKTKKSLGLGMEECCNSIILDSADIKSQEVLLTRNANLHKISPAVKWVYITTVLYSSARARSVWGTLFLQQHDFPPPLFF